MGFLFFVFFISDRCLFEDQTELPRMHSRQGFHSGYLRSVLPGLDAQTCQHCCHHRAASAFAESSLAEILVQFDVYFCALLWHLLHKLQ